MRLLPAIFCLSASLGICLPVSAQQMFKGTITENGYFGGCPKGATPAGGYFCSTKN